MSSLRAFLIVSGSDSRFFRRRHGGASDLYVYRAQVGAAGEIESFPLVATEPDVGGRWLAVDDAAELLALRIEDPNSARAAAIDIARHIDFHAVGHAGLAAAQVGKYPVALFRHGAVGEHIEHPDMAAPAIVDVEHAFVRRECKPVRENEIVDQKAQGAKIGREAVHARKRQVPLLRRCRAAPGLGEIDGAVGLDYDIVRPIEAPALEAVRDHGETAVEF